MWATWALEIIALASKQRQFFLESSQFPYPSASQPGLEKGKQAFIAHEILSIPVITVSKYYLLLF